MAGFDAPALTAIPIRGVRKVDLRAADDLPVLREGIERRPREDDDVGGLAA
jgi:hypothetical protein